MDRTNARLVAATFAIVPAGTSILLLLEPHSTLITIIAVGLLGLASGGENDCLGFLASKYFGMRNFGTLFGAMMGLVTLGLGIGPILGGYVYDLTHSYAPLLLLTIPISLTVGLLLLTAGRYPSSWGNPGS